MVYSVNETAVVVQYIVDDDDDDDDVGGLTSGRYDVDEADRQPTDVEVQVPSVHEHNATELPPLDYDVRDVTNSSDDVNATLNVTSFPPPPPDATYVEMLFKIAHIFHFVGIGILAFFVLQV